MRPELMSAGLGQWMATKLAALDFMICAAEIEPQVLSLEREGQPTVEAFVTSVARLDGADVVAILQANPDVKLITNIKRGGHVMGDAMRAATEAGVGVFQMGDTIRALRDADLPADYQSREVEYLTRSLGQHSRVDSLVRLDEARYRLDRSTLGDVVVLVTGEYDVTADVVRRLIASFDDFDLIASSNPNGHITDQAAAAAANAGKALVDWKGLLAALHRPWT